jgi:glycine oxidase
MSPTTPEAPERVDVVVVGGGVIGLSTAWRLSATGRSVALCDAGRDGVASWAAGGMLAPVTEVRYGEDPLLELGLASSRMWPIFAEDLATAAGADIGYRRRGTVLVARDRDDRAALEDLGAYMRSVGVEVESVSSREVRELEPALAPTVRGGLHAPDDHRVDNRALVRALLEACDRGGVIRVPAEVAAVDVAGGEVSGVRLASGEVIRSATVVVCAGAWSGSIDGVPPDLVPVRPVKGEVAVLRARSAPLIERTVRGLDVYLVPRDDGRVVVGASMEERGFDTTVRTGAVLDLLRDAYELVPGITELDLLETRAGLRPGSPDNAPIIGAGGPAGLVVATGHHRNGLLLSPITAQAVVELVETGSAAGAASRFGPGRFRSEEGAA